MSRLTESKDREYREMKRETEKWKREAHMLKEEISIIGGSAKDSIVKKK